MIHWLLQSFDSHPDLARGVPPPGLLSAAEQARWAGFRVDKRKREWLLGRWTAKQLLQSIITSEGGDRIDLRTLTIANDADGVPFATLASISQPAGDAPSTIQGLPEFVLSISHRGNYSLCAAVQDDRRLGADIEHIELQSDTFVADYLTAEERDLVAHAPAANPDRAVMAIWSGKEAALKALHLGLSVDTRAVTCLFDPDFEAAPDWKRFKVCCNMEFLPTAPALVGWWRTFHDYVLTLVAETRAGEAGIEPDSQPAANVPL